MEGRERMQFAEASGGEVIALRGRSEKHFSLGANRYQAITYPSPVHFRDENGKWADIDNTLEEVTNVYGRRVLRNKASDVRVEIPVHADSASLISITRNGKTFAWSLDEAESGAGKQRSGAETRTPGQQSPPHAEVCGQNGGKPATGGSFRS